MLLKLQIEQGFQNKFLSLLQGTQAKFNNIKIIFKIHRTKM